MLNTEPCIVFSALTIKKYNFLSQILSPHWNLEETDGGRQDIKVQTDVPAVSHSSQSACVTTASGKTEKEEGQDWHGITEREIKAAVSCASGALAPSGGKDGAVSPLSNRRDPAKDAKGTTQEQKESMRWKGEGRAVREDRRSPSSWSHRADREAMTSDSKIRSKRSPHRRQPNERHAGSGRRRSPSRSKERRWRASSPPQEFSGRAGERREGRKHRKAEEVTAATEEEEGKWPRDEPEGQWEVVDGVDVRWELEEGERPSSSGSKSSSSSTGGRRRYHAEKRRASPEPLDDWRPRKHKHRE